MFNQIIEFNINEALLPKPICTKYVLFLFKSRTITKVFNLIFDIKTAYNVNISIKKITIMLF